MNLITNQKVDRSNLVFWVDQLSCYVELSCQPSLTAHALLVIGVLLHLTFVAVQFIDCS